MVRLDLLRRTETSKLDNLRFTPLGREGQPIKSQVVLNWNKETGEYEFNEGRKSKEINEALRQFKKLLNGYVEKFDEVKRNESNGAMVNTRQYVENTSTEAEAELNKLIEATDALIKQKSELKKD